jgi:hypothetical protein
MFPGGAGIGDRRAVHQEGSAMSLTTVTPRTRVGQGSQQEQQLFAAANKLAEHLEVDVEHVLEAMRALEGYQAVSMDTPRPRISKMPASRLPPRSLERLRYLARETSYGRGTKACRQTGC